MAQTLPNCTYEEPNFTAVKTATQRCLSIIETLVKSHDYARCDQLQKKINDTEKALKQYCHNPEGN